MSTTCNCLACGNNDTAVRESRTHDGGETVRRRRTCRKCGHRFSTVEIPADVFDALRQHAPRPLRVLVLRRRASIEGAL